MLAKITCRCSLRLFGSLASRSMAPPGVMLVTLLILFLSSSCIWFLFKILDFSKLIWQHVGINIAQDGRFRRFRHLCSILFNPGVLYQPLTELVSENEISKEICSWKMKMQSYKFNRRIFLKHYFLLKGKRLLLFHESIPKLALNIFLPHEGLLSDLLVCHIFSCVK